MRLAADFSHRSAWAGFGRCRQMALRYRALRGVWLAWLAMMRTARTAPIDWSRKLTLFPYHLRRRRKICLYCHNLVTFLFNIGHETRKRCGSKYVPIRECKPTKLTVPYRVTWEINYDGVKSYFELSCDGIPASRLMLSMSFHFRCLKHAPLSSTKISATRSLSPPLSASHHETPSDLCRWLSWFIWSAHQVSYEDIKQFWCILNTLNKKITLLARC